MRRKNIIRRVLIAIVCFVAVTQILANAFVQSRYAAFHPDGIRWYVDGIVIDEMHISDHIELKKIYVAAYPWALLSKKILPLYIDKMTITAGGIPSNLRLPVDRYHTNIRKVYLKAPYQKNTYVFSGKLTIFDSSSYRLDFHSITKGLHMVLSIDCLFDKERLTGIDISADDFLFDRPEMRMKRGSGWLSFQAQNTQWQSSGEIEAGYFAYAGFNLLNAHLTVSDQNLQFTAKTEDKGKSVLVETSSKRLTELQTRLLAFQHSAARLSGQD